MNTVARQSLKYTIIGYSGSILGILSTFFLFTYDLEFYGKLRFILPTAQMFLPIVVFGISFSNVKFFQMMHKDGKHQNMLTLSLLCVGINFGVFTLAFFLYAYLFPQYQESQTWLLKGIVLPLILVLALSAVFNKYISNYKKIAVSNIFENVFPKIANIIAFSVFFFLGFPEYTAYICFLSIFILGLLGYFYYANRLEKIKFDFSTAYFKKEQRWRSILDYSFYGFLGNLGSYLALSIDSFMISEGIGFQQNGIYATVYSIVSLVGIPAMGLYNISAPIINNHFQKGTMQDLHKYHQSSSLSLFLVGLILLSCLVVGFPYLTSYMPNSGSSIRAAEPLVWILGGATLFELATGFNSHIISMSKYYRFNILVMLLLAIFTIGLNYYFIHHTALGILGVGIAYASSLTIFNVIKITFNYTKFKVFPLSIKMLYALLVGVPTVLIVRILPEFSTPFFNLVYKPLLVITIFLFANITFKFHPFNFHKIKS